jgi:2-oxoglutarate dehydrogenase E1 component
MLLMAFNPSHLETVDPVVGGQAWAKQRAKGAAGKIQVLPVLIHGDAAFIGQGVVAEVLQMSQLESYNVGGTIHIVIDNQVGFTTGPKSARTSQYSSDIMKSIQAPVLHVNGDDAEACQRAAELAMSYRQKFKKDICIRLVSYRKHGHNEGDEPMFTQPVMYEKN